MRAVKIGLLVFMALIVFVFYIVGLTGSPRNTAIPKGKAKRILGLLEESGQIEEGCELSDLRIEEIGPTAPYGSVLELWKATFKPDCKSPKEKITVSIYPIIKNGYNVSVEAMERYTKKASVNRFLYDDNQLKEVQPKK